MWMPIDIFKSCMQTPKSGKIFWKGQGKVREFWKVEMLATLKVVAVNSRHLERVIIKQCVKKID